MPSTTIAVCVLALPTAPEAINKVFDVSLCHLVKCVAGEEKWLIVGPLLQILDWMVGASEYTRA